MLIGRSRIKINLVELQSAIIAFSKQSLFVLCRRAAKRMEAFSLVLTVGERVVPWSLDHDLSVRSKIVSN